jgi:hypothetical protein
MSRLLVSTEIAPNLAGLLGHPTQFIPDFDGDHAASRGRELIHQLHQSRRVSNFRGRPLSSNSRFTDQTLISKPECRRRRSNRLPAQSGFGFCRSFVRLDVDLSNLGVPMFAFAASDVTDQCRGDRRLRFHLGDRLGCVGFGDDEG